MLRFYLYDWQLLHSIYFCFLRLSVSFSLLLTKSANQFEYRILVRIEALLKVLHEISWIKISVLGPHAQKFMRREQVSESSQ